ncbi:hypothetical protein B0J11DRAFT_542298 [Dendryphion nanum]|uniref:Uncharacterized protein n=1 Tax=Dendryphion nanum TaxID=256645 RepID=A0A9P9D5S8_9PLEO|nr:hypothetical protein B0J11DRAFT_542298 [Dendryphion nanum]
MLHPPLCACLQNNRFQDMLCAGPIFRAPLIIASQPLHENELVQIWSASLRPYTRDSRVEKRQRRSHSLCIAITSKRAASTRSFSSQAIQDACSTMRKEEKRTRNSSQILAPRSNLASQDGLSSTAPQGLLSLRSLYCLPLRSSPYRGHDTMSLGLALNTAPRTVLMSPSPALPSVSGATCGSCEEGDAGHVWLSCGRSLEGSGAGDSGMGQALGQGNWLAAGWA